MEGKHHQPGAARRGSKPKHLRGRLDQAPPRTEAERPGPAGSEGHSSLPPYFKCLSLVPEEQITGSHLLSKITGWSNTVCNSGPPCFSTHW